MTNPSSNPKLAESIEPYLQALTRYIDGVYTMAMQYSVPAKDAAFHAKHMQDAVLGIRRQLHHELCDVLDLNAEGIRKPCNCRGRTDETPAPHWNFWVFEEGDEIVLGMMGPALQAASFSVAKDSVRADVLRQFKASSEKTKCEDPSRDQRQGERGPPYCAKCGEQLTEDGHHKPDPVPEMF